MSTSLQKLQRMLGYEFRDKELVKLALTHRSCGGKNNERLEFLGDALLNFTITEVLYHKFPKSREGALSRLRACLVKGETLVEIAKEMELGEFVLLGAGEIKSGGHRRSSILADTVEALIGAIFLDAGIEQCQHCIKQWFHSRLETATIDSQLNKDPKTLLQEWLQSRHQTLPSYELINVTGKDHNQTFLVECHIEGLQTVTGKAKSRRGAEQNAARHILDVVQSGGN